MTVAQLLQQARDAHRRYRDAAGRINKQGTVAKSPQLLTCGEAVRMALSLRIDAEVQDPQRTDPAWMEDAQLTKSSHDALVSFYVGYLARDVAA